MRFKLPLISLFLLIAPLPAQNWIPLFDGKTLNGWEICNGKAGFRVEQGVIIGKTAAGSPNSFLCTTREYGDFVLELETWTDPALNSGIQIRSHRYTEEKTVMTFDGKTHVQRKQPLGRVYGYQVEIANEPSASSGGIYDEARRGWLHNIDKDPAASKAFHHNQWNHYKIEAIGDRLRTWVNGVPCADVTDSQDLSGFIALQVHAFQGEKPAEVRWRNLRIQDLGRHLWKPLWNGTTLDGWTTQGGSSFTVVDGAIRGTSKPDDTRSGLLMSDASFGDLTVRLKAKLIKGNSGFFIRTSKENRAAYELEIDEAKGTGGFWETGPNGRKWVTGPEDNGAARAGEWNEITASLHGHRIVFHVNGAKTMELLNDTQGRTEGCLGLQAHGSLRPTEVWFKELELLVKAQESPRPPDGTGAIAISGQLKQWHKVTLTLDGPFADEQDSNPNPFTDYRLTVAFRHSTGSPSYLVPGYFAADGNAAESSATAGTKWRAHLSPDKPGRWDYTILFVKGPQVAVSDAGGTPVAPIAGKTGFFNISPTDKRGRDFRAKGRLQYIGGHYLRFAGNGEYFLKAGPDAPENLLAYTDFDGTRANRRRTARPGEATPGDLKSWEPHLRDWRPGDPVWKENKGKGLIGALNYLAGKGLNGFSFLTYNAGGDGDDIWPFADREQKFHFDCSKLDQWAVVFDHATAGGLHLHFKLQENELDDNRRSEKGEAAVIPESLDGGKLGPERKMYLRELIARFAHNLAVNWNLGEENSQSTEEQRDMTRYIHDTDPYHHPIVLHTFPNQQDKVYTPLLGDQSLLTGLSLQNSYSQVHQRTLKWRVESARAGRPWVIANDEQNPADMGVPPDPGYQGHDGIAVQGGKPYNLHDVRKLTLWGNLMAGGAGVEYYFGYKLPQNDLMAQDFRSRNQSWDYARIALGFFHENKIPFWAMANSDELIGNAQNDNSKYCLAKPGEIYLVYLPGGGSTEIDLSAASGSFSVNWFNPREGGTLQRGTITRVRGGGAVSVGAPPAAADGQDQDWLVLLRKP